MIILYNPPSSANHKPVLPMSLLALGAVLEGEHDYRIIDGNLEADPVTALDRTITESGAGILGVTVMPGPQLGHAVPLCRELKASHPALTIVWGGYFPTQHYEACLRSGFVDYVVRGHGELIFKALVGCLERGEDPSHLPGLAFRAENSAAGGPSVIQANPLAPIPHPEAMPDWPYHCVDVARYIRPTFMGSRTLPHHSSYGCPFFCNFCAVVNMVSGRWLSQSAERTASVTRRLVREWGVNAVDFYDNNFFTHEARTAEFAKRIADLGIGWWGEGRIDTLLRYSDRSWELMRQSGLRMVFLGAESGSDETLQRMNKGGSASTEKTLEIVRKMKGYGIVPELSFVLGNPPDPEADTNDTVEFIRKVKRLNPAAEIILYMYTPVPLAGELYERAKAEGFKFPETLEEWVSPNWMEFSQRRSVNVPWLDDPLRRHIRDFQWVLNAYYPTTTDIRLAGFKRVALRVAAAWRYHTRVYGHPIELRALNRLLAYQRPETSGF
ncbi:MAG: B12-binding domain-containing radical SAM protein [Chloroflexi bacterium]|nr:B12-binding domain-containing radical SAM protein [Chloroflexota bacterium]